mgnify:CR=1 FL=1
MIYIVVPVFNRLHFTKACIDTLIAQDYDKFKIIVVDHGSTDGTSEYIQVHFPEVIILKGDESMWWTGATNFGIQKALKISECDDDLVLTINNDVEVYSNYLNELLQVYHNNKPCLVGSTPVDINNPGKVLYVGTKWNSLTAT